MKYLGIGFLIAVAILCSGCETDYKRTDYNIRVAGGDTLWAIASRHLELNDKKMSMEEYVYTIKEVNKLDSKNYLQPGQILIVPVFKEKSSPILRQ